MPRCHGGMYLQRKYEQPIREGRKTWEGRATGPGKKASRVFAGDTVSFKLTGDPRVLQFRVSKVQHFGSCMSMLKTVGVDKLLPDFKGSLHDACLLYEGLVGGGAMVAWCIDSKTVKVAAVPTNTRKTKKTTTHWNKQVGMVQPGTEQPRLKDKRLERMLAQFGRRMVAGGHRQDQAFQHMDRLRYCARSAPKRLHPFCAAAKRLDAKELRSTFQGWAKNVQLHGHLQCSYNWLMKFLDKKSLAAKIIGQTSTKKRPIVKEPSMRRGGCQLKRHKLA